jgi:hypothetical protein
MRDAIARRRTGGGDVGRFLIGVGLDAGKRRDFLVDPPRQGGRGPLTVRA